MKFPIIAIVIFFLTFPAWAGKFLETFDGRNLEIWTELTMYAGNIAADIPPGSWEILDGELHATVKDGLPRLLAIKNETWKDYEVEFDVKPLEKHGPGVIVIAARITVKGGVVCMIGTLGDDAVVSEAECVGGKLEGNIFKGFGIEKEPPLKLKNWSKLKLSVKGTNLLFWINDRKVIEGIILEPLDEQTDFSMGGVGLGLANYTARFDNFVISGNGIPNKGKLLVTPRTKLATMWGSLKRL